MDVEKLKALVTTFDAGPDVDVADRLVAYQTFRESDEFGPADLARSVIVLTEDLAARDKAHECDAQIAADLIAGEQAKRYEVEAERDKLRAALKEIMKHRDALVDSHAKSDDMNHEIALHAGVIRDIVIRALAQATQETSNATQKEKQNAK